MSASQPLRLFLEPESQGRQIAGRLYDEQGEEHRFCSWLGLLTLLETARIRANAQQAGRSKAMTREEDRSPRIHRLPARPRQEAFMGRATPSSTARSRPAPTTQLAALLAIAVIAVVGLASPS